MILIVAVVFTNPFDTAKVRLQLQGEQIRLAEERLKASGATASTQDVPKRIYNNSFDTMMKIYKNEGIKGLQKGLVPAIGRESSKNLFRIGLFDPVINIIHPPDANGKTSHVPAWKRLVAGAFCGTCGALSCNPFELIKTRLQSSANSNISVGYQHHYTGLWDASKHIYKSDGFLGFYNGAGLSVLRSIFGSGSNLAAYSMMKEYLLTQRKWADNPLLDMTCGMSSGVISCLFMNPIDVTRTRFYNQPYEHNKGLLYKNGFDAVRSIFVNEGPSAFYKGIFAHFLRIGPHFCLTFMFLGVLRRNLNGLYGYLDIRDSFKSFDKDHDGSISTNDELKATIKKLIPIEYYAEFNSKDKGEIIPLKATTSKINVDDQTLRSNYENEINTLTKEYSQIYINKDKKLNFAEWENFLSSLEKRYSY